MKKKKVTIRDIRKSIYDANLDTEYGEALAHAMMELGYVSDSPLNLYLGTEKQNKELERVETKRLNNNEISEIIHLMMYEMRDDFQYGRFKPIVDYYISMSKEIEKEIEEKKDVLEHQKPICNDKTYGNMYKLICFASKKLKQNNMYDESRKMIERATLSYSYDEALHIIKEYIEIADEDELEEEYE
ncbi:MAG: hypothetical protein J6J60_00620 [Clostridia bacterium]|nr:hypothetical protein [Clostridia bacterium]